MSSRRNFVKSTSIIGLMGAWRKDLFQNIDPIHSSTGIDWEAIRAQFPIINWDKINFNSGSAGVMPTTVSDHLIELVKYINSKAPYEVWNEWQSVKKENIRRLSMMVNAGEDELQIVRNTTEALNMIIYGLRLEEEDEVIIGHHDYGFAVNAWENRAERDRFNVNKISVDFASSDSSIIESYKKAITDKTRVVHLTYMTHRLGYIMPVQPIIDIAHAYGAEVVLDGAHVVGQIEINIEDIDCDYFATSLHKWLNAPHGTGLLYVKRDRINDLYNFPSSYNTARGSIDKFEHLGTRAFANEIGVSAALDFHELISAKQKSDRLQELKEYWTQKVKRFPGVKVISPTDALHSCAIAVCSVNGVSSSQLKKTLDNEFNIHVKTVGGEWGSGIRVSVNIFTSFEDLDKLVFALEDIAKKN